MEEPPEVSRRGLMVLWAMLRHPTQANLPLFSFQCKRAHNGKPLRLQIGISARSA